MSAGCGWLWLPSFGPISPAAPSRPSHCLGGSSTASRTARWSSPLQWRWRQHHPGATKGPGWALGTVFWKRNSNKDISRKERVEVKWNLPKWDVKFQLSKMRMYVDISYIIGDMGWCNQQSCGFMDGWRSQIWLRLEKVRENPDIWWNIMKSHGWQSPV